MEAREQEVAAAAWAGRRGPAAGGAGRPGSLLTLGGGRRPARPGLGRRGAAGAGGARGRAPQARCGRRASAARCPGGAGALGRGRPGHGSSWRGAWKETSSSRRQSCPRRPQRTAPLLARLCFLVWGPLPPGWAWRTFGLAPRWGGRRRGMACALRPEGLFLPRAAAPGPPRPPAGPSIWVPCPSAEGTPAAQRLGQRKGPRRQAAVRVVIL